MSILFIFTILCSSMHICGYASNANYTHITPTYSCSTSGNSSNNNSRFFASQNLSSADFLSGNQFHAAPASPGLESMSTEQLQIYFAAQKLSEDEILSQRQLYMSNAYIELVKNYAAYPAYIKKYYQKYLKYGAFRKCWSWIKGSYKSGMAQRFRELHQNLVRAEQAKQRIQEYQAQQAVYHEQLQKIEYELLAKNVQAPYTHARVKALRDTTVHNARIEKRISVTEDVQRYAKEYEIERSMLEQGLMNPYEYQLHTEFIDQLNVAVELRSMPNRCREYQVFLDAVGYGVSLGLEANHNHEAATATHWADCGWKLLDIAQAIGEGVALGCYNTVMLPVNLAILAGQAIAYPIAHPVESLNLLGQGIKAVLSFFVEEFTGEFKRFGPQEGPPVDFEQEWNALLDRIDDTIAYCEELLAKIPLREKVKHLTAFGTEIFLPTKFFKAGKILCTRMRPLVRTALQVIQDEQIAVEVAGVAGENVLMKVGEVIPEAVMPIKNVIQESATALGLFYADFMKKLEPEIATLRSIFDNKMKGFGEFGNKYIKIDYKHILGMDLFFDCHGLPKLSGFHHDFMNAIEQSRIIEFSNKIIQKSGCYCADLTVGGIAIPKKTFFPAHWSQEKVVSSIYEAYDSFVQSGVKALLEKNGKYRVEGITREGIKIEMFITQKGKITTAYPKVRI